MTTQESSDQQFMRLALNQASLALDQQELPIGCVLVDASDNIIALSSNSPIKSKDPTAHAEVNCLRYACAQAGNYRLPKGCTAYVSLEPCMMCLGAFLHARLDRLVIAARDSRDNSIHKSVNLYSSPHFNHSIKVVYDCLQEESKELLDHFFKQRRL
jgi:tRNA(adenine34) deaminase